MSRSVLSLVLLCAVAVEGASKTKCWSDGNGEPAKWWQHGERVDRGSFWYECEEGELIPKGCFSATEERMNIGQTYEHDGYEMTCQVDEDGNLNFKYSACVTKTGTYTAGEQWNDDKDMYYYECKEDGRHLRSAIAGCIKHDKSGKLPLGERYDYGNFTYECQTKPDGSVSMCSVGCVHDGQRYGIGETWPEDDFIFYCNIKGGRCQKRCVGCQYENRRLYNGDRYRRDDTVYQCTVRPDAYSHKPVACVSTDRDGVKVDRVLGCRWYLQTKDSKIEQTCVKDDGKTKINTVGCIYRYKGYDTIFLEPSSYTIWNKVDGSSIGLACKPTSYGAELVTFPSSEASLHASGLKYDSPKGR